MSGPDQTFCDAAAQVLGPRGFTRDAELMAPWLTDWRGARHRLLWHIAGQDCQRAVPLCGRTASG